MEPSEIAIMNILNKIIGSIVKDGPLKTFRKLFARDYFINTSMHFLPIFEILPRNIVPVIKVSSQDIRFGILGSSIQARASDPFQVTICQLLANPNIESTASELSKFYDQCQFPTLSEFFKFDGPPCRLSTAPATCSLHLLPWRSQLHDVSVIETIEERASNSEDAMRKCAEYGVKLSDRKRHGNQCIGPVSRELLECEFRRYKYTLSSILENGYQENFPHFSHINGRILEKDKTLKIHVYDGLHRTAVLLALKTIEIKVALKEKPRKISFENLDRLPTVKKNLTSLKFAQHSFDKIFKGDIDFNKTCKDGL